MSDSVMLCFVQGFEGGGGGGGSSSSRGGGDGKEPKLQAVKNKLLRKSRYVESFTCG